MKNLITSILLFITVQYTINAQTVTFRNAGYLNNLKAVVNSSESQIGLENDIKQMSEVIQTNKEVDLGVLQVYRNYYLRFIFKNNVTKLYQVTVLPNVTEIKEITTKSNVPLQKSLFSKFKSIFTEQRMKSVLNSSFQGYVKGSIVSAPVTIAMCITASATMNPVFVIKCGKGVVSEGLAFGKEFSLAVLENAKTQFTEAELKFLRKFINDSFAYANLVTSSIGGANIVDLIKYLNDVAIEEENVKLGVGYTSDLYQKYDLVFELLKK